MWSHPNIFHFDWKISTHTREKRKYLNLSLYSTSFTPIYHNKHFSVRYFFGGILLSCWHSFRYPHFSFALQLKHYHIIQSYNISHIILFQFIFLFVSGCSWCDNKNGWMNIPVEKVEKKDIHITYTWVAMCKFIWALEFHPT